MTGAAAGAGQAHPPRRQDLLPLQDYSEWLSKGKAGVPVELGLNVCVMESADGFILHHQVTTQVDMVSTKVVAMAIPITDSILLEPP